MAEKPKDEGISYETHLDLIERELNAALKNIEEMRSKQSEAKARFQYSRPRWVLLVTSGNWKTAFGRIDSAGAQ